MSLRKLLIAASAIFGVWAISSLAAAEGSRLEGTVTDPSGAPITGAFIFVHWDPAGSSVGLRSNVGIPQDLTAQTDTNGRFSVTPPPGFYDVLACASAFSPNAKKIRTLPGRTFKYEVQLQLDTIITHELGDKFQ